MFDLKRFRKDFKLTQTEVAFILGCGQPNIAAIERYNRELLGEQIKTLEDKYGDLSNYMTNSSNEADDNITDNLSNWSELVNKQQNTIEKLLDMLEKEKDENARLSNVLANMTEKVIEKMIV